MVYNAKEGLSCHHFYHVDCSRYIYVSRLEDILKGGQKVGWPWCWPVSVRVVTPQVERK